MEAERYDRLKKTTDVSESWLASIVDAIPLGN